MAKKQCDRCGKWAHDVCISIVGYERWCRSCARDHAVACVMCGSRHPREYAYRVGRNYLCKSCRDKYAIECEECGNCHTPGDIYLVDGRALCWDCARH